MEARRLIQFGSSSHVVSIPKAWITENGLKKGDLIFINKNGNGELVLLPREKKDERAKKREITININSRENKSIEREIAAAYVQGNDVISLIGRDIKKRAGDIKEVIENLSKNLMGLEILEKNSERIVISNLFDNKAISINNIIVRADVNLKAMFEQLLNGVTEGFTKKHFDELYEADYDVNKFYFLMWRLALQGLREEPNEDVRSKLINSWWFIMNMEKMGDELKRVARLFTKTKLSRSTTKEALSTLVEIRECYQKALTAYHKKDLSLAVDIMAKKEKMVKECDKLAENDPKTALIAEKLKAILSYIHDIAKCSCYFL